MVFSTIYSLASQYVNFSIEGKRVNIPYSMVTQPGEKYDPQRVTRTTLHQHYAAKGTVEQIRQDVKETARQHHFDLTKASAAAIHQFMLDHGIGIDCSGYVYHVLDGWLQNQYHTSLDRHIVRYPGLKGWLDRQLLSKGRVRRCSAATLTSSLNTVEIVAVKDARVGDMIRLTDPHWWGKHIALIVAVTPQYLTYTHSSEQTKLVGPHLAKIKITHPNEGLEKQQWLEKLQHGKNYRDHVFKPEQGDGIRRLRFLT